MKNIITSTLRAVALVSVATLSFATSSAIAGPSLVSNGGFETITGGPGFLGYTTTATNWAHSNGFAAVVAPGTANTTGILLGTDAFYLWGPGTNGGNVNNGLTQTSISGGNFISSDADPATAVKLTQVINGLTVGNAYTIIFEYAAAQYRSVTPGVTFGNGPSQSGWNVMLGNESFATSALAIDTHGFSGWKQASFTHVATSTSEVLSFMAFGSPAGVPPAALLDGISVTENANVPLPATALLFALGGLMGLVSRKKKTA